MRKADFSARDAEGKVVFFVPLWKRKGITLELFDDYWRDVHGPVCARLPGQFQYWQFHLAHSEGGIWPEIEGIQYRLPEEDQFDGIAELTFRTPEDRVTWFKAAAILMDDEHNLFSKAIGYNTSAGNSKTFVDGLPTGDPNGRALPSLMKLHVMIKQRDGTSQEDFRRFLFEGFSPTVAQSPYVMKLRTHLFDEVDNTRPPAAGVDHSEPSDRSYQASIEIAFENRLEMEMFFASSEYTSTLGDQVKYIKHLSAFPSRGTYTFVYDGKMTLAGQRSSSVAALIDGIGAVNQLQEDVTQLMLYNKL